MYDKVPTNRNVVEHEKEVEKFWKEQDIFKKSMRTAKKVRHIPSMTDRLQQTESHISAMC